MNVQTVHDADELAVDAARIGRITGLQPLLAGLHQFGALLKVLHGKPLVLFQTTERSDIREMHGAAPLMNRSGIVGGRLPRDLFGGLD